MTELASAGLIIACTDALEPLEHDQGAPGKPLCNPDVLPSPRITPKPHGEPPPPSVAYVAAAPPVPGRHRRTRRVRRCMRVLPALGLRSILAPCWALAPLAVARASNRSAGPAHVEPSRLGRASPLPPFFVFSVFKPCRLCTLDFKSPKIPKSTK
jgi:hypothetical protein